MPKPRSKPDSSYSLKLPQLRVLVALRGGAVLSRQKICERVGFSEGSGTLNYALNGMKQSKGNPRPHPGLVELGLVIRFELEIDGMIEVVHQITPVGEAYLLERGEDLPQLRDKDICTNNRYREEE